MSVRYWQPQFHLRWFMARAPKIRMALSTRPRTCKALRRRQPRLTYRMRILLTCPTEALTDVIGSNQPLPRPVVLENGPDSVPIVPLRFDTIPANFVGQFDVQGREMGGLFKLSARKVETVSKVGRYGDGGGL